MRYAYLITVVCILLIAGFAVLIEFHYRETATAPPQPAPAQNLPAQTAEKTEITTETSERSGETSETETSAPSKEAVVADTVSDSATETTPPEIRLDDRLFHQTPKQDRLHTEHQGLTFTDWNGLSEDKQQSIAHRWLFQKFGDIPQVRQVIAADKRPRGMPVSIETEIADTEATLYLWPHEETAKTLALLKQMRAAGVREVGVPRQFTEGSFQLTADGHLVFVPNGR